MFLKSKGQPQKMTIKSSMMLRELARVLWRSPEELLIEMLDQASNTQKAGYISYEGGDKF